MLKLIQGYYHFLALGKFMEQVIVHNDLSELAMDYPLKTWVHSSFMLKESLLKNLLYSLHKHPDKRNVYGYLTEISAFRGIFSIVRELIETHQDFRDFLKTTLQDQYFPFEQTIRFLRNVLNHSTSSGLHLKQEDYDIQKDYILSPKQQRINKLKGSAQIELDFVYAKYIAQWQGSKDYGIHLVLDFSKFRPGMELEKLMSWHTLYLLAELCFNLSQLADVKLKQLVQRSSWALKVSSVSKKVKKSDSRSTIQSLQRKKSSSSVSFAPIKPKNLENSPVPRNTRKK